MRRVGFCHGRIQRYANHEQTRRGLLVVATPTLATPFAKPLREIGGFTAMSLDTLVQLVRPPFAWREFVVQSWFTARVSILPALLLNFVFNAFVIFMLDVLLIELGAGDLSGVGAAFAVVAQIGPAITVLVIGGSAATAMCADLGARTIREEIDAMKVMGINPIQRLAAPRVVALILNSFLLNGLGTVIGLSADYLFAVYVNNVNPGAYAASLTLVIGLPDAIIAVVKAMAFGLAAGLIACYKGFTVGGGPQGVGNAVNETVVYTFMALYVINTLLSAVLAQVSSR
jgi:phospholipid/cholesterol/gamma-HCH transport system permease protein